MCAQAASLDRLVLPARLNESGGNGFTLVGESGNNVNVLNFKFWIKYTGTGRTECTVFKSMLFFWFSAVLFYKS